MSTTGYAYAVVWTLQGKISVGSSLMRGVEDSCQSQMQCFFERY
ncbi:hypothetical protein [Nostoc sp.]